MNRGTLAGFGRVGSRERRVTNLPHGFSGPISGSGVHSPRASTASGVCVADSWKNILWATGAGSLKVAAVYNANGVAKDMHLRIVRDGDEIFNSLVASTSTYTYVAVGQIVSGTTSSVLDQDIPYERSLLIQYKCSLSETDGANITYRYEARA